MRNKYFIHETVCVYPQTELWQLCTCPIPTPEPPSVVEHDPLCDEYSARYEEYCLCDVIAKARGNN